MISNGGNLKAIYEEQKPLQNIPVEIVLGWISRADIREHFPI